MRLTETEKESIEFILKEIEYKRFILDDSVGMRVSLENVQNAGLIAMQLKRLCKKGIIEAVCYDTPLLYVTCNCKKLLLAYNGIFVDTLEDHLGEKYSLDINLL